MYQFSHKNSSFSRYFRFKGFDQVTGLPQFEEASISHGNKYMIEDNILHLHSEKLLEKEQYKLIL